MNVDKVQARGRSPVSPQPRVDVLHGQGVFQKGIIEQVDLSDR